MRLFYFEYQPNSHYLLYAKCALGINTRVFNDIVENVTGKRTSKEMVNFLERVKGQTDYNDIVNEQLCSLKYVGKWLTSMDQSFVLNSWMSISPTV